MLASRLGVVLRRLDVVLLSFHCLRDTTIHTTVRTGIVPKLIVDGIRRSGIDAVLRAVFEFDSPDYFIQLPIVADGRNSRLGGPVNGNGGRGARTASQ